MRLVFSEHTVTMQENREAVDEDALKKIEEPGINLLIVYLFFKFSLH
jgi:hypothetical protein